MMIINDANLIDQVNPFLIEAPGTWSRPYEFSDKDDVPPMEIAQWDSEERSAGCQASTSGSDNQVAWCNPGEPNCPMQRMLEPTQRVDPDIPYPDDPGNVPGEETPYKPSSKLYIWIIVLILAAVIISVVKF